MTNEITAKKILRNLGIIALFVIIIGYGVWKSRDVLFGIDFTVTGITDGMRTTEPLLSFSGVASRANTVTVDGRTVPGAQDGTWKDTVALLPGYNVITITTTDKFGKTKAYIYRLYYDEPTPLPVPEATPAPVSPTPASQ